MDSRIKTLTRSEIILHNETVIDINERAAEMELAPYTVYKRILKGYYIEEALAKKENMYNQLYKAFGVSKTVKQWSEFSGIALMTLYGRLTQQRLSIEESLTKQVRGMKITPQMRYLINSYEG